MKKTILLSLFFISCAAYSENKNTYNTNSVNPALKKNANTIVRVDDTHILISSSNKMTLSKTRVITILNERGTVDLDLSWGYEPKEKIKKLSVKIFNSAGELVRKLKSTDFKDVSAYSGSTFHSDSRIIHASVHYHQFPYTVEIIHEIETPNTAFIPVFIPIRTYNQSLEKAQYSISWPEDMHELFVESSFSEVITDKTISNHCIYTLKAINAVVYEENSPSLMTRTPYARWAFQEFHLENHDVIARNWQDLGLWMYNDLLKGGLELQDSTKKSIKRLVRNTPNIVDRAKLVYTYMQDHTRYMSIQLGIGGWKPTAAREVDGLGYGDCKGLVNYTQALLAVADVPSQYVVVYAGNQKKSINEHLPSIQGNHVILRIPNKDKPIWLECTSQTSPFGQLGSFTDDRLVLMIDSTGGKLTRTPKITEEDNILNIEASYSIDAEENIKIDASIKASGIFYSLYERVERFSKREKHQFYESELCENLNDLEIENIDFTTNNDSAYFEHTVAIFAENYAKKMDSGEIIFQLNPVLNSIQIPENDTERKSEINIERGLAIKTEVSLKYNANHLLGFIPTSHHLQTEFGEFAYTITQNKPTELTLVRTLMLYQGKYKKEKYQEFRAFFKAVSKIDKSKISLTAK